jgi:hypothetical protein
MITILDCLTGEFISSESIASLARKLKLDPSKLSRLYTGYYLSVGGRYVLDESFTHILEEIETGKCFFCPKAETFFMHMQCEYQDNVGKYLHALFKGRQYKMNFRGKSYRVVKRSEKHRKRREKLIIQKDNGDKLRNRRIAENLRCRLRAALARHKFKKTKKTFEYIGCSIDFFVQWLESQFTEGMSWDKRSVWHIDHIKPCNTFDLSKEDEREKCFHYTNLRPLNAKENLKRPKDGSDIK